MSKVLSFKKPQKEINFKVFARHVGQGEIDEASRVLRELLQCDLDEAERITLHFKKKYEESSNVIMQMMLFKSQIEQGEQNNALTAIQELLGVSGLRSVQILGLMSEMVEKS